jgi:magnesium chelatase family protein
MPAGEKSETIKQRVLQARNIQWQRQKKNNAQLTQKELRLFCVLKPNIQDYLDTAVDSLGLSARAYDKIIKTARTIADLENKPLISLENISEAIAFRNFSR